MANYEFKAHVLNAYGDVLKLQREHSRLVYLDGYTDVKIDAEYKETVNEMVSYFFEDENALQIWREAERINLAYYARVKRLKDRISSMLREGRCYFLTLTFSDATLERVSAKTRRRYVTYFLKSLSDTYVANIDFGSENHREHYHAVVMADGVDMSAWDCFGFSKAQKIASEDDYTPIAKYISKLTNHAVKATTSGCRAIYSK